MRNRPKNNSTAVLPKQNTNSNLQNSFHDAGSNQSAGKENSHRHSGQNVGLAPDFPNVAFNESLHIFLFIKIFIFNNKSARITDAFTFYLILFFKLQLFNNCINRGFDTAQLH